jgi:Mg2+ and Co2+ transporter CorA
MNFDNLPELHWYWGYAVFWGLVFGIVVILLWLMRRSKIL